MADIPPHENSPAPPIDSQIKRFGEWIIRELVPAGEKFLHFLRSQNEGPGQLLEAKPIEVKREMKKFFDCNLPQIEQSSIKIGGEIGLGGQSSVHHVKSPDYGDVAFKIFHSKNDQECNKRELKYAVLRHPNIVQSLAVVLGENNMPKGFLMEFMPHSLADEFEYSIPQVLDWMQKVCTALLFLHNLKIMHRDVKPANIMVEADKSGFIFKVKLTDLGVAGSIYHDPDVQHTCAPGTMLYQAQEMINGHYDEKVDVHSTGLTLWQLIHRKLEQTQFSSPEGSESNPYFAKDCPVEIKDLINECCCAKKDRLSIEKLIDRLKTLTDEYKKRDKETLENDESPGKTEKEVSS